VEEEHEEGGHNDGEQRSGLMNSIASFFLTDTELERRS